MSHTEFASCIEACHACAIACDHCAAACLQESDPKPMARCVAMDIDCAALCRLAAGYMARGSEFAQAVCTGLRSLQRGVRPASARALPGMRPGMPALCRRMPKHGGQG